MNVVKHLLRQKRSIAYDTPQFQRGSTNKRECNFFWNDATHFPRGVWRLESEKLSFHVFLVSRNLG
jgi:hypothetical protein